MFIGLNCSFCLAQKLLLGRLLAESRRKTASSGKFFLQKGAPIWENQSKKKLKSTDWLTFFAEFFSRIGQILRKQLPKTSKLSQFPCVSSRNVFLGLKFLGCEILHCLLRFTFINVFSISDLSFRTIRQPWDKFLPTFRTLEVHVCWKVWKFLELCGLTPRVLASLLDYLRAWLYFSRRSAEFQWFRTFSEVKVAEKPWKSHWWKMVIVSIKTATAAAASSSYQRLEWVPIRSMWNGLSNLRTIASSLTGLNWFFSGQTFKFGLNFWKLRVSVPCICSPA